MKILRIILIATLILNICRPEYIFASNCHYEKIAVPTIFTRDDVKIILAQGILRKFLRNKNIMANEIERICRDVAQLRISNFQKEKFLAILYGECLSKNKKIDIFKMTEILGLSSRIGAKFLFQKEMMETSPELRFIMTKPVDRVDVEFNFDARTYVVTPKFFEVLGIIAKIKSTELATKIITDMIRHAILLETYVIHDGVNSLQQMKESLLRKDDILRKFLGALPIFNAAKSKKDLVHQIKGLDLEEDPYPYDNEDLRVQMFLEPVHLNDPDQVEELVDFVEDVQDAQDVVVAIPTKKVKPYFLPPIPDIVIIKNIFSRLKALKTEVIPFSEVVQLCGGLRSRIRAKFLNVLLPHEKTEVLLEKVFDKRKLVAIGNAV